MISLVFVILFFLCLGIAVVSVLMGYQLIQNYNTSFLKNYFYYLISFYAFALYGVWGQIIIRTLLSTIETSVKSVELIANFLPILGVPFLFVAWIMLINMAYTILERQAPKFWSYAHVLIFVMLALGSWFGYNYLQTTENEFYSNEKYFGIAVISVFEFFYYLGFVLIIFISARHKKSFIRAYYIQFAIMILFLMIIRTALIPFSFMGPFYLGIALIVYFISSFFPLFYLWLHADKLFLPVKAELASDEKIEWMYKKYKITKREKEIVQQICQGKTNQQIADDLFISLQTVKDHTHRIYSKIGIRSRMQLVQMVS